MNLSGHGQISKLCNFKDKNVECLFHEYSFSLLKHKLKIALLSLAVIFGLFIIPDLLFQSHEISLKASLVRVGILAFFAISYLIYRRAENVTAYLKAITIVELIYPMLHVLLIMQYPHMNFSLKSMDVIVIIMFYFAIPNKWICSVAASLEMILAFAVFSIVNAPLYTQDNNFAPGAVYITIALIMSAFGSYRSGFHERSDFYKNLMLKRLIGTDTLTGVGTRAKFDEEIKIHIDALNNQGRKFSIAIFDIDDFKGINDTLGHIAGDSVLIQITEIVRTGKGENDILIRWGGEEFVVIFPETGIKDAADTAEKLRKAIEETVFSDGAHVTCSFGVTESRGGDTPVSIMQRADKLMYSSKASGKNKVTFAPAE